MKQKVTIFLLFTIVGISHLAIGQSLLNEGNKYYYSQEYDKAIEIFTRIIENSKSTVEVDAAYFNRGNAYYHSNDFENAILDYTINIGHGDLSRNFNRAKAFYMIGKYEKALNDINYILDSYTDKYIKIHNDGIMRYKEKYVYLYWKGKILMEQNKLGLALKSCEEAIKNINDNNVEYGTWSALTYSLMAEIYINKENYIKAKECYINAAKELNKSIDK